MDVFGIRANPPRQSLHGAGSYGVGQSLHGSGFTPFLIHPTQTVQTSSYSPPAVTIQPLPPLIQPLPPFPPIPPPHQPPSAPLPPSTPSPAPSPSPFPSPTLRPPTPVPRISRRAAIADMRRISNIMASQRSRDRSKAYRVALEEHIEYLNTLLLRAGITPPPAPTRFVRN